MTDSVAPAVPVAAVPAVAASADSAADAADRITMFGAEWCGDCRRSKRLLETLGVDYDYVDLLAVEDGADRAAAISGRTQIPLVVFPDGTHVVEPSDSVLHAKLTELGRI